MPRVGKVLLEDHVLGLARQRDLILVLFDADEVLLCARGTMRQ